MYVVVWPLTLYYLIFILSFLANLFQVCSWLCLAMFLTRYNIFLFCLVCVVCCGFVVALVVPWLWRRRKGLFLPGELLWVALDPSHAPRLGKSTVLCFCCSFSQNCFPLITSFISSLVCYFFYPILVLRESFWNYSLCSCSVGLQVNRCSRRVHVLEGRCYAEGIRRRWTCWKGLERQGQVDHGHSVVQKQVGAISNHLRFSTSNQSRLQLVGISSRVFEVHGDISCVFIYPFFSPLIYFGQYATFLLHEYLIKFFRALVWWIV